MKKFFLGLGLVSILLAGGFWWKLGNRKIEFLNPLAATKSVTNEKKEIKVVGFLPTYMIGKTIKYNKEVDDLIFLGIEVDEKGNLIWDSQSKKVNSETYLDQKEAIWENGGKNILGIKLFEDEKIDSLMSSEEAQDNLINQLRELEKTNKFDGINVDFEYQGNPTAILAEEIPKFMIRLKNNDLGEISLDVLVNTINRGSDEQIKKTVDSIDNLIVMAYDFHRPGVDYAGAVAPIGSEAGERNIMEVVEKILTLNLDKKKIIMAYPLYGYEWKTYQKDFGSQIIRGWYQMASWSRTQEIIKEKQLETNWDQLSMTPWIEFEENGEIHQIYFENKKSLKIKMDLVRQNQFGGVGFWALGYEGEDKSVWNLIKE